MLVQVAGLALFAGGIVVMAVLYRRQRRAGPDRATDADADADENADADGDGNGDGDAPALDDVLRAGPGDPEPVTRG